MNRLSGFRVGLAAAALAAFLSSTAAQAAVVYVKVAPPAPIVEVRTVAPSAGHVWIAGYHRWDGAAYVWVATVARTLKIAEAITVPDGFSEEDAEQQAVAVHS